LKNDLSRHNDLENWSRDGKELNPIKVAGLDYQEDMTVKGKRSSLKSKKF
jgi:hypothetical protein